MNYIKERNELIITLKNKGITSEKVLNAIAKVPREIFVTDKFIDKAYDDISLPLFLNQTISQPYTVAKMTELLDTFANCEVLEIGTGSGYQACILAELGCNVFSIERISELNAYARIRIEKLGYNIQLKVGDGTLGWNNTKKFDRIIITAAAPAIPETLLSILKPNGILVIPVGNRDKQEMTKIIKTETNNLTIEKHNFFKFVPLIGKEGWK
jgi:protein-L-isoaspartate(D-aspartate) O-methyltransferase